MADSRELQFQRDIISAMTAQGWLTGPASGFDQLTLCGIKEASL